MIKLQSKDDISKLRDSKNISIMAVKYISDYLYWVLEENNCTTIESFGALFYLEERADMDRHLEMGLSSPIIDSVYEFTEKTTMSNKDEQIDILHSCFVISNSYAVSLFCELGVLDAITEEYLLSDCV